MIDQVNTATLVKLLRKLSGQENCYTIPKLYVQLTECHVRALVLNQLVFYSDKSTRHEEGWFDKPYEEWEAETYIKERTLRNIFKEFKEKNWCDTRVELVNGKTTLCCKPYIENIMADIEQILNESPPGKICRRVRKNLPEGSEKFAVPIYTDKNTDKNTDMCGESQQTHPIEFSDYKKLEVQGLQNAQDKNQQAQMELEAFENEGNKSLFAQKFGDRQVSYDEMFLACKEHYMQQGRWVGSQRFKKWINQEKVDNYAQRGSRGAIKTEKDTHLERLETSSTYLLGAYQSTLQGRGTLDQVIPDKRLQQKAMELYQESIQRQGKDTQNNALASQ